jgi:hypothetical protein
MPFIINRNFSHIHMAVIHLPIVRNLCGDHVAHNFGSGGPRAAFERVIRLILHYIYKESEGESLGR